MLLQPSILPAPFSDENLVLDITIYHHFSCLFGELYKRTSMLHVTTVASKEKTRHDW
jgi:hypothetical protein